MLVKDTTVADMNDGQTFKVGGDNDWYTRYEAADGGWHCLSESNNTICFQPDRAIFKVRAAPKKFNISNMNDGQQFKIKGCDVWYRRGVEHGDLPSNCSQSWWCFPGPDKREGRLLDGHFLVTDVRDAKAKQLTVADMNDGQSFQVADDSDWYTRDEEALGGWYAQGRSEIRPWFKPDRPVTNVRNAEPKILTVDDMNDGQSFNIKGRDYERTGTYQPIHGGWRCREPNGGTVWFEAGTSVVGVKSKPLTIADMNNQQTFRIQGFGRDHHKRTGRTRRKRAILQCRCGDGTYWHNANQRVYDVRDAETRDARNHHAQGRAAAKVAHFGETTAETIDRYRNMIVGKLAMPYHLVIDRDGNIDNTREVSHFVAELAPDMLTTDVEMPAVIRMAKEQHTQHLAALTEANFYRDCGCAATPENPEHHFLCKRWV